MSALTQARFPNRVTRQSTIAMPMTTGAGMKVFRGSRVCVDTSTHFLAPFVSGNANLIPVGTAQADVDNTSGTGTVYVLVLLDHEVVLNWYDSVTGAGAVSTTVGGTSLFQTVYGSDDHTVTTTSSGNSRAGRVWDCTSTNGVAVENIDL